MEWYAIARRFLFDVIFPQGFLVDLSRPRARQRSDEINSPWALKPR